MDGDGEPSASAASRQRIKVALNKSAKVGVAPGDPGAEKARCHVCGELGHCAGFQGATYVDCSSVSMACYNCKQLGHSTQGCPHRIRPDQFGTAAASSAGSRGVCSTLPKQWSKRWTLPLVREWTGGIAAPPYECWAAAYHAAPSAYDRGYRWRVDTAVLRLHQRRISLLSFDPAHSDRLIAADKSGELSVWNFIAKSERSVWTGAHRWLINALSWLGPQQPNLAVTASADGTVRLLDIETRQSELLCDVNPKGWTGVESQWRMFYAVSAPPGGYASGPILAGDDVGRFWALDPRDRHKVIGCTQAHKRGCKVQGLHHNPLAPELVASCANDWAVKLWDVRTLSFRRDESQYTITATANNSSTAPLTVDDAPDAQAPSSPAADASINNSSSSSSAGAADASSPATKLKPAGKLSGVGRSKDDGQPTPLGVLPHQRVVTAALFSPVTGSKLMTTCIDNRLRVWDNLHACTSAEPPPPSSEIVHSHDFARYLSPFRAVWDPKDRLERTAVIGRYISEPFPFGGAGEDGASNLDLALHPIDVIDVGPPRRAGNTSDPINSGVSVRQQLVDPLLPTISPVVAVHHSDDVIACGSSRSVYLWRPVQVPLTSQRGGLSSSAAAATSSRAARDEDETDDGSDGDDGEDDGDGDDFYGGGLRTGAKRRRSSGAVSGYFGVANASSSSSSSATARDPTALIFGTRPASKASSSGKKKGKAAAATTGKGAVASTLSAGDISELARQRVVVLVQGPREGAGATDDADGDEEPDDEGPFGSGSKGKKGGKASGKRK